MAQHRSSMCEPSFTNFFASVRIASYAAHCRTWARGCRSAVASCETEPIRAKASQTSLVTVSRLNRSLVILNTGADGLEKSMYVLGGAGALARGYNCLILNGTGDRKSVV